MEQEFETIERFATEHGYEVMMGETGMPVKMWTQGVPIDDRARRQLLRIAQMPFIFKHVAVMCMWDWARPLGL